MSTNHTANYNLCQWVPSDKVLRTDFNEDNAKLDAALAGLNRRTSAVEGRTSGLEDNAYTIQNPQVVVGHYTGNGALTQAIHLGFRPKVVLVLNQGLLPNSDAYRSCGMAVDGFCSVAATITNSGFQVTEVNNYGAGGTWDRTNSKGTKYVYFAFK